MHRLAVMTHHLSSANKKNIADLICRHLYYCYEDEINHKAIKRFATERDIKESLVVSSIITLALTREYTVIPNVLSGLPGEKDAPTVSRYGREAGVEDGSPLLFLSYRRVGSSRIVGRLYDALTDAFGYGAVFRDIYSMQLGQNFRLELGQVIPKCEVTIVLIDPNWISPSNGRQPRIFDTNDPVRIEIETALQSNSMIVYILY